MIVITDLLLFFWKTMAISLGGFVVVLGVMDIINGIKSKKWTKTTGKIIYSQNTSNGILIKYSYILNDMEYISDNIFYNRWPSSKTEEKILLENPYGKEVIVSYDSNNPKKAALIPGLFILGTFKVIIFGLFFFVLGLIA